MNILRAAKIVSVSLVLLGITTVAKADLIPGGSVDLSGTGFGAVNTILTFQGTGQDMGSPESGCVGVSASGVLNTTGASVCEGGNVGGNEKPPAGFPHNQTFMVSNAAQIGIVFNADQPNGGPITLSNLTMSLFNSSGSLGFTSDTFSPITFTSTQPGIGNSGFLFVLDPTQAAEAQTAINAGYDFLGLSATATPAKGGPETFFLTNTGSSTNVAEPGTLVMLAIGLIGLGWLSVGHRRQGIITA
jgi:PEP-CTERM motif